METSDIFHSIEGSDEELNINIPINRGKHKHGYRLDKCQDDIYRDYHTEPPHRSKQPNVTLLERRRNNTSDLSSSSAIEIIPKLDESSSSSTNPQVNVKKHHTDSSLISHNNRQNGNTRNPQRKDNVEKFNAEKFNAQKFNAEKFNAQKFNAEKFNAQKFNAEKFNAQKFNSSQSQMYDATSQSQLCNTISQSQPYDIASSQSHPYDIASSLSHNKHIDNIKTQRKNNIQTFDTSQSQIYDTNSRSQIYDTNSQSQVYDTNSHSRLDNISRSNNEYQAITNNGVFRPNDTSSDLDTRVPNTKEVPFRPTRFSSISQQNHSRPYENNPNPNISSLNYDIAQSSPNYNITKSTNNHNLIQSLRDKDHHLIQSSNDKPHQQFSNINNHQPATNNKPYKSSPVPPRKLARKINTVQSLPNLTGSASTLSGETLSNFTDSSLPHKSKRKNKDGYLTVISSTCTDISEKSLSCSDKSSCGTDVSLSYIDPMECSTEEDNCRPICYNPGASSFFSMITPLSSLVSHTGKSMGSVEFLMRRKNKVVTLQWESFTGVISVNGVAFLTVSQIISNVPAYPMSFNFHIKYKGVRRISFIEIDPSNTRDQIKMYLNLDGSGQNVLMGDMIEVPSSSINWIAD